MERFNNALMFEVMMRRALLHLVQKEGGELTLHHEDLNYPDYGLVWRVQDNPMRLILTVVSKSREKELKDLGAESY